ncbi:MAG: sulfotransferase family protein [Kiritimatiellia bacterium]
MNRDHLPKMIFVVGAPRSGSSLLLDFLTVHKNVGWIPQTLDANPAKLSLASSANRLNWPFLGEFFLERRSVWERVPEPANGDGFWSYYLKHFAPVDTQPFVPGPEHLLEGEGDAVIEAVKEICYRQRRDTFVAEFNGFPRIRMMREIFPDAIFLQVIRDPRSVAYQMVRRTESVNHALWKERKKWIALMPGPLQERLQSLPETPLNFCGILVRWYHDLYRIEMGELPPDRGLEVAYSDLLSRPDWMMKKVMNFLDFPLNKRFRYFLKFHNIQFSNRRTQRNLNTEEAKQLAQAVAAIEPTSAS